MALDIDEELDVHLHVTHDSLTNLWTLVSDCGNNACCIKTVYNSPTASRDLSSHVACWLDKWIKELQVGQLEKSREYLTARLAEVNQRISEVSE